ncbi:class I SAM-dependent methyltransferase [Sulfobacillus harzensis]|uniref:Class I SAM-dependent methyltransferase n=1 Tax=Sulfobacillus harzensis TaxID=2729629 RepID=A0A7Y0L4U0_9FIRM|nr:class I SAM-dependent methyltransferase [Sulfobacillus harzensis]NMP21879.1 class I SAM-dependent methyltransferase [Sulfobacillus harzensis]
MDTSDSRYVASQYATEEKLQIRIDTHRHYGIGQGGDIFDRVTQAMTQVQAHPERILDVGPGTGTWYRAMRGALGPLPFYTGMDQSEGMIASLRQMLIGDSRSKAMVGDAQTLPWPDGTFAWVGLHFMLYHVPDIARALSEAYRVLQPGGVLTACTNGREPYRELWELGDQVAHELGLPGAAPLMSDRFNLSNGAAFFPDPPRVYSFVGGFRFPQAEPAVRYMASGPIRSHLGEAADDPDMTVRALNRLADLIQERIAQDGVFEVHSSSGFFLLEKQG